MHHALDTPTPVLAKGGGSPDTSYDVVFDTPELRHQARNWMSMFSTLALGTKPTGQETPSEPQEGGNC